MTIYVVRSDKHTQEIQRMTLPSAVLEIASVMPASIYDSRFEVMIDLLQKRHLETRAYLYELSAAEEAL